MLILSRRSGETIVLKTETEEIVMHFDIDSKQVAVSIDAPQSVRIWRGELLDPTHYRYREEVDGLECKSEIDEG